MMIIIDILVFRLRISNFAGMCVLRFSSNDQSSHFGKLRFLKLLTVLRLNHFSAHKPPRVSQRRPRPSRHIASSLQI